MFSSLRGRSLSADILFTSAHLPLFFWVTISIAKSYFSSSSKKKKKKEKEGCMGKYTLSSVFNSFWDPAGGSLHMLQPQMHIAIFSCRTSCFGLCAETPRTAVLTHGHLWRGPWQQQIPQDVLSKTFLVPVHLALHPPDSNSLRCKQVLCNSSNQSIFPQEHGYSGRASLLRYCSITVIS